ncbi:MAG: TetR/AcrR family transcriptional regulator [Catenulispora sp.]|nr:TetR/AcrR family transcriptional regulator [Catenulispora sp.]
MREPQQDRSRATRSRLLEACVECLAEVGWSATTVAVVAERAGVSRGAAQHHFPTREELITAALERMFDERIEQTRAEITALHGASATETVVARLVEHFTGTLFKAALQVWTAAAADEALRQCVLPLEQKFGRVAYRMALEALGVDDSDEVVSRLVQATLDLARGLGLADVLTDDSVRRADVVRAWAAHLDAVLRERAQARA